MSAARAILITGVSGSLGQRLLRQLAGFQVIGVDVREPTARSTLFHFERLDLAEERSCDQLLQLMRAYRPQAVAHLAFVMDPVRNGIPDRKSMWQINVVGTSRVCEAVAEYNRMQGGIDKFIFLSSAAVYGPEARGRITEDTPLNAHSLLYAVQQQEADITVQVRAAGLRGCRTFVLRPQFYGGPGAHNYLLTLLRGVPGGKGRLGARLRRRGTRLPVLLPSRGGHLEDRLQFVHVEDMARLVAHIAGHSETHPQLTVLNVAGRGDPISLRNCLASAGAQIKRVPTRFLCRQAQRFLWGLGISEIPPTALPYLLGSRAMDTARLRVFLGEHYRSVIQHTCEEALVESFKPGKHEEEPDVLTAVDT